VVGPEAYQQSSMRIPSIFPSKINVPELQNKCSSTKILSGFNLMKDPKVKLEMIA
jgi:hypothetical protein